MTPEDLLNLVAERAALSNLQDEDDHHLNEIDEIDRQIVNAAPDIARDLIEARLTLAAEQGKAEGAPSEGWIYDGHSWSKDYPDGSTAMVWGERGRRSWMRAAWPTPRQPVVFRGRGFEFPNDRAAMIAADKATP